MRRAAQRARFGRQQRANLEQDVLGDLVADDPTAAFDNTIAALGRRRTRPPLVFIHSSLPHAVWRYLPDGRTYPRHHNDFPGLEGEAWGPRQWLADQNFQRHVLQAEYSDRLVGRLIDKLRAAGLYDQAVIVVTADHGVSFRSGMPRRGIVPANLSDIAFVPFIVKYPGQRSGKIDDRAVRTEDVLPTIAKAAAVRLPWRADGRPADERKAGDDTVIDVTRAGKPTVRQQLGPLLEARRQRERTETRLLANGIYGLGARRGGLGRRVDANAKPAPGRRATLDAPADYAAVALDSPILPAYVSGETRGVPSDAQVAVAVNGRVEAMTRVYPQGGRGRFAAIVPPASFHAGQNSVAVFQLLPGDRLVKLGAAQRQTPYRLLREHGREVLVEGRVRRALDPGAMVGSIDVARRQAGLVDLIGWAGLADHSRPASEIVAFAGRTPVGRVAPTLARDDLAHLDSRLRDAGFELAVPAAAVERRGLRVSAVRNDRATELKPAGDVARAVKVLRSG